MRRRDLVAGLGGVVALGATGWYAVTGNGAGAGAGDDTGIEPVTVETLDAPHSDAGTMTVPAPDRVTVIDVFATWCAGCDDQLRSLAEAREQVRDGVQFVSVTNEAIGGGLTRADIREFWREHAGRWPVALDDKGTLTTRLEARTLPYTAVTDPDGRVVYAEQGVTSPDVVVSAIQQARTA